MPTETTKHTAKMLLPAGAKQTWSAIMRGESLPPAYERLETGEPIVMAYASFADGTQVIGGVCKGRSADANSIFMWVLDGNGMRYPGWPIDLGDTQDFAIRSILFAVDPSAERPDYTLEIVELAPGETAPPPASEPPAAGKPAEKSARKPAMAKVGKKAATKKAATKKTSVKKAATKKAAAKKTSAKKAATKKAVTKKTSAKKAPAKKAATKKTSAKKAATKKTSAKKAPAKKAATKKTSAKKGPAKKAATKKAAK
jgi:hypothetical protein